MNIFNIISTDLIQHFHMSPVELGWFSAVYFVANVASIPLTGILLDKYPAHWLLLVAVLFSTLGIAFLGLVPFSVAILLRVVSGACNSMTILGAMRIAYRWLPEKHWGLGSSLVVSLGMLGGLISQDPLAYLIDRVGWQQGLLYFCPFGLGVAILILCFVREAPSHYLEKVVNERGKSDLGRGLRQVLGNPQNWLAGIFTAGMNGSIILIGGLWGVAYVVSAFGISHFAATEAASNLFLGAVFGGLCLGFVSDYLGRRRAVMGFSALVSCAAFLFLILSPHLSLIGLEVLLFGVGFLSSAQDLSFAVASEQNDRAFTGMSLSMIALLVQGGSLLAGPLSGYLIGLSASNAASLVLSDFRYFVWLFPVMTGLAFLVTCFMRDHHRIEAP